MVEKHNTNVGANFTLIDWNSCLQSCKINKKKCQIKIFMSLASR